MLNEASFISLMPPNSRNSKCSDSQTFISYHSSLPIPLPPPHSVAQPPIKIIDKISSSKTKTKNSNKKKQKHKRSKSANHRNNSNKNQSKNLNQRVTSFSQNAYIPELMVFTPGPGPGKYPMISKKDPFENIHPAFALQKAERLKYPGLVKPAISSSISHQYLPVPERIPGYYMTNEDLEILKVNQQRKTSFCIQTIMPDLNIFTSTPGVGRYNISSRRCSINNSQTKAEKEEKNNKRATSAKSCFTIPKAPRPTSQCLILNTRPVSCYIPSEEKIPGHYSINIERFPPNRNFNPSPADFRPEKSLEYLRKTLEHKFGQTERFKNLHKYLF